LGRQSAVPPALHRGKPDLSRARKLPAFISDFEDFNSSVNVDSDGNLPVRQCRCRT
jgi:hypothetical protein